MINWEKIVSISTAHYVFPALYLQLKNAELLSLLPTELVDYMEEFTSLNRERNEQIIKQALEITRILNIKEISPVFLKGTAHLLDGLYKDIGERMVGDIDFLVEMKDLDKSVATLRVEGYHNLNSFNAENIISHRHYPRLIHEERIAAIEIHHQIFASPYHKLLECKEIIGQSRKLSIKERAFVPKDEHQIVYNILNTQLPGYGYYYGHFRLSQMYDLVQLSVKEDIVESTRHFGKKNHFLRSNLFLTNELLGFPVMNLSDKSCSDRIYLRNIRLKINSQRWYKFSEAISYFAIRIWNNTRQLCYAFVDKKIRRDVYKRLKDPKFFWTYLKSYFER